MVGLVVLVVALAVAGAAAVALRVKNGRFARRESAAVRLDATDLGIPLGERATLVQFSSSFCSPCRATRAVLGDVVAMTDGIGYVDIDAESRLELVRRLNILRTPTVLVLDARGEIVERASGLPRKVDVVAALGRAIPA